MTQEGRPLESFVIDLIKDTAAAVAVVQSLQVEEPERTDDLKPSHGDQASHRGTYLRQSGSLFGGPIEDGYTVRVHSPSSGVVRWRWPEVKVQAFLNSSLDWKQRAR